MRFKQEIYLYSLYTFEYISLYNDETNKLINYR